MLKQELVIDLGSKKIAILKKDGGIALKEPSVIIATNAGGALKLVACGNDALKLIGKIDAMQQIVYPIEQGVIVNEKACEMMLKYYIERVIPKSILRPRLSALVCISCGLTNVEKHSIENVCNKCGLGEVTLVEIPIAIGGLSREDCCFVVDIGGSKTELGIVSEQGIIAGCCIDVGGDAINEAITDYIANKFKMIVHYNTTEKIKKTIATMRENDISQVAVNGRSIIDGGLKSIRISAQEIREAFAPVIDKIISVIEDVSLMIPDSMAEIIADKGIYLCGGTSYLVGLDEYIANKLMIKCNIIEQPDEAVAQGGARYLYSKQKLNRMLNVENVR